MAKSDGAGSADCWKPRIFWKPRIERTETLGYGSFASGCVRAGLIVLGEETFLQIGAQQMMVSVQGLVTPLVEPPPDRVAEDGWVPRFGGTERFAHWWTVVLIVIALLTGLSMGDERGAGVMLWLHIGSVALIVLGLVAAAVVGDHRALGSSARRVFTFDARDRDWLRGRIQHPLQRHPHPRWGQFNTGQKLLAWALTVSILVVIATGIASWRSGGESGGPHGSAVAVTMILLGAHIFMAVVNPATRPALTGMVFGRVRRSWAATHHRAWLDDVDGSGGDS